MPRSSHKSKASRSPAAETLSTESGERINKVLAAAGLGSRRDVEELILEGRVQIDGQIVDELGARVDRDRHEILVDGEPLPDPKRLYFAVNKPTGVVSTARDPAGRPRVTDLLPASLGRLFNVGRLDMASEGLILLTNDGELANRLAHPRYGVTKTYQVQVAGQPSHQLITELRRGVHLSEAFARPVSVRVKSRRKQSTVLEIVLDEGRNREIRRMLARLGHKVQRLRRVAVGPVRLGELPTGAYRPLTPDEVTALRKGRPLKKGGSAKKRANRGKPSAKSAGGKKSGRPPRPRK